MLLLVCGQLSQRQIGAALGISKSTVSEIARRLVSVNGLIPTHRGDHEFYLVKKAWVFGSTIKGSDAPNDLDVLLFAENAGARQKWQDVGFDPVYYKDHGMRTTRPTPREAKMWLQCLRQPPAAIAAQNRAPAP